MTNSRGRGSGPWELGFQRLSRDLWAITAGSVIFAIILLAILAPGIATLVGHASESQYHDTGLSPSGIPIGPNQTFPLGTDGLGRDLLVRLAYGARISLLIATCSIALAVGVGVIVGLAAGWFGGWVDALLSRLMDIVLSLPFLVFSLALVAVVGPSLIVSIVLIAFFNWASVGRIVRGQTMSIREQEFVGAARLLGSSNTRIMFVEILPNVATTAVIYSTLLIPSAVVSEATLSFLGLGVVPPTPSWGSMLSESMAYYRVAWWFVVFPGSALLVTTLAFSVLGDSVRDAFDPQHDQMIGGSE